MTETAKDYEFALRVLGAVARADVHDTLWWQTHGEWAPITFFVNCSDLFARATADVERITPDNVDALERAFADVRAATGGDPTYGPMLFCARTRKRRPRGAAYPSDHRLWPLFDACGPERELGLLNPSPQPAVPVGNTADGIEELPPGADVPCHKDEPPTGGGADHCGLCGTKLPEPATEEKPHE